MKVFNRIASLSILISAFAFASGANAPKGWWRCTFSGSEWQMISDPNGIPHSELRPQFYSSDWEQSRDKAYNEAQQYCLDWSDTECRFESCRQKKSHEAPFFR